MPKFWHLKHQIDPSVSLNIFLFFLTFQEVARVDSVGVQVADLEAVALVEDIQVGVETEGF